MKIKKKKKKNLERKKNRGEEREKKKNNKNNHVTELNYFSLVLNDHVSNFRLPRKEFLMEWTPKVKLITA